MYAPDPPDNPRLPVPLRLITAAEIIALGLAGFGLYFLPAHARLVWAWEVSPFNAQFLGAIYLASLMAVAWMQLAGRWVPARLVLALIFWFTGIVLVVTVAYLPKFLLDRWVAWAWFVLYGVLPFSSAYYWWRHRALQPAELRPLPLLWRRILQFHGVLLVAYTAALIVAPAWATGFWPWPVDDFHARVYSGMYVAPGVAALMLSRWAMAAEVKILGLAQAIFAGGGLLGTIVVDGVVGRVDWGATGTWVWVGMMSALTAGGLTLVWCVGREDTGETEP